jgi:hypothetical protein
MALLFKIVETVVENKGIITILIEKPGDVRTLVLKGQPSVGSARADQNGGTPGGIGRCFKVFDKRRLLIPVQSIDRHFLGGGVKKDFFLGTAL